MVIAIEIVLHYLQFSGTTKIIVYGFLSQLKENSAMLRILSLWFKVDPKIPVIGLQKMSHNSSHILNSSYRKPTLHM